MPEVDRERKNIDGRNCQREQNGISPEWRNLIVSSDLYGEIAWQPWHTNAFGPANEKRSHRRAQAVVHTERLTTADSWRDEKCIEINEHWRKCLTFALNFYSRHNCSALVKVARVVVHLISRSHQPNAHFLTMSLRCSFVQKNKGWAKIQGPINWNGDDVTATPVADFWTRWILDLWRNQQSDFKADGFSVLGISELFDWRHRHDDDDCEDEGDKTVAEIFTIQNKMMIICISFLNYAFRWRQKWMEKRWVRSCQVKRVSALQLLTFRYTSGTVHAVECIPIRVWLPDYEIGQVKNLEWVNHLFLLFSYLYIIISSSSNSSGSGGDVFVSPTRR